MLEHRRMRAGAKVRILLVSQYWYPERGVPQRRWRWVAEVLSRRGNDFLVITPPIAGERKISFAEWASRKGWRVAKSVEFGELGEQILRCGFLPSASSLVLRAAGQAYISLSSIGVVLRRNKWLRDRKIDIVIGTVPTLPTALSTFVVAKLVNKPYIIDLRDAWPELLKYSDRWNRSLGKQSLKTVILGKLVFPFIEKGTERMLTSVLQHSAGVLVTSSYLAEDLAQNMGISAEKISVLRNVFPTPVRARAIKQVKSPNSLKVLYAGTMGRAQGLPNVLDAARILRDRGIDICFKFIGAGVGKQELIRLAQKEELKVEFSGAIPPEQLYKEYEWADTALVHLDDWPALQRTVPSKTYELMRNSVHITAVAAGETAELIRKTQAGSVVPPRDPEELADLWEELAVGTTIPTVGSSGKNWVEEERQKAEEQTIATFVQTALSLTRNESDA
ncbi:glycosyltransferase family 4 protein [Corynebacterium sp.]|uniref:glycosyltransferase family 4 protein n=1 Tax=Corynebacterium sp. TaxID=1720 RepID=UPI0026DD1435|nr:glycosyltransferase family 4 protein [Corynebacterium sp.]MDO5031019.1 glycosyltransferase family 4 protein [Corynebacterium sp.]